MVLSFLFCHWYTINFQHGIKAGLLLKEGEIEIAFYSSWKLRNIRCVLFFWHFAKSFKALGVFFFKALFYSKWWCPPLMLEVLKSWMAITFTHGKWSWNFFCMKRICGKSLHENYCHRKLNLEGLFLKEALLNTIYLWRKINWFVEQLFYMLLIHCCIM
jgi:hypothetical protein